MKFFCRKTLIYIGLTTLLMLGLGQAASASHGLHLVPLPTGDGICKQRLGEQASCGSDGYCDPTGKSRPAGGGGGAGGSVAQSGRVNCVAGSGPAGSCTCTGTATTSFPGAESIARSAGINLKSLCEQYGGQYSSSLFSSLSCTGAHSSFNATQSECSCYNGNIDAILSKFNIDPKVKDLGTATFSCTWAAPPAPPAPAGGATTPAAATTPAQAPSVSGTGAKPLPPGFTSKIECDYTFCDMIGILTNAAKIIFALAGGITLFFFLYGSFFLIASAGNQSWIEKGKTTMKQSITGLIIVIVAYQLVGTLVGVFTPGFTFKAGYLFNPDRGWQALGECEKSLIQEVK